MPRMSTKEPSRRAVYSHNSSVFCSSVINAISGQMPLTTSKIEVSSAFEAY